MAKKEKFLVVSGVTTLGEFDTDELAKANAKELAMASGRYTQVMSPEQLGARVSQWQENDAARAKGVEDIAEGIAKSSEHTFNTMSADIELENALRGAYQRKYMSSTFDPQKLTNAITALWASPKHTSVRDGVVVTGYRILNIAKDGAILSARPGAQRKSQVEWLLLEYGKLLMSQGKGINEIVAEVC